MLDGSVPIFRRSGRGRDGDGLADDRAEELLPEQEVGLLGRAGGSHEGGVPIELPGTRTG